MADSSASGGRKRQETAVDEPPRTPRPARLVQPAVREIGGPEGPEPTRYGDWEKGGRCTDF
jgi:hypothetical protein